MTGRSASADPAWPESYGRRLSVALLSAAAVTVGVFTIAGFAARSHWRLEQLCHFRVQYFWLLSAAALILLLLGKRWRAAIFALLAAVNLATIVPIYLPETLAAASHKSSGAGDAFPLRVMTFNVRASNQHHDDVVAYLRGQPADFVLMLEVNDRWSAALRELQPQYPHQHHEPRTDNFGIALLSRLPWTEIETVTCEEFGVPSLPARFDQGDTQLTFIGTHPVPPGSRATSRARDKQLAALARLADRETVPVILAGDLNVTSWSPYFGDLLRNAGLRDSRQGRGVQMSWVSRIPLTNLPLDHILMSPGIVVQQRSVGPDLGSDHRPVVADLRLPKQ